MDNKRFGYLVILIGIIFIIILSIFKIQMNQLTDSLMFLSGGDCFLEDGTCIHKVGNLSFIIGSAAIVFTLGLGVYLILFSKTTKSFETAQKSILNKLKATKGKELKEERFKILLTGLDEYEKKVLKAVRDQDGISQSTLKYRADLSKTKLSMVLSQLEKKELLTKVKKGKINNVFLKKAL